MFFLLSKLLSAVTQPLFWLALWWLAGLLLLGRRRKLALGLLWSGLAILGLLGFQAVPDALLRSLEARHASPPAEAVARHAGLIVLGGAFEHPASYVAHGQPPLGGAAERMTAAVALLRRHAGLELVFSGGEGRLWKTGIGEATLARAFFIEQGVAPERMRFEEGARNTRENALETARLLGAACRRESWLLVTSAAHMPRAYEEFRAVGCQVTPYPVDYRTGAGTPLSEYSLVESLGRWQGALHEWLGIGVYRLWRRARADGAP